MGAWWANDPLLWWGWLAIFGASAGAVLLIVIIAILGRDEPA